MQALMGSSRFCHLLSALHGAGAELDEAATPTLAALAKLTEQFPALQPEQAQQEEGVDDKEGEAAAPAAAAAATPAVGKVVNLTEVLGGHPLMPTMLMDVVNSFRPRNSAGGLPSSAGVVMGAHKSNSALLVRLLAWQCSLGACAAIAMWRVGSECLATHVPVQSPLPGLHLLPCACRPVSRRMLTTFWSSWWTACTRSWRHWLAAAVQGRMAWLLLLSAPRRRPPRQRRTLRKLLQRMNG
jgi:hypothetical protein